MEYKTKKSYEVLMKENKYMIDILKRTINNLSSGSIQQKNFIIEVEDTIKKFM